MSDRERLTEAKEALRCVAWDRDVFPHPRVSPGSAAIILAVLDSHTAALAAAHAAGAAEAFERAIDRVATVRVAMTSEQILERRDVIADLKALAQEAK